MKRTCTKCKKSLPLTTKFFRVRKRANDTDWTSWCISCQNSYNRQKHKEKRLLGVCTVGGCHRKAVKGKCRCSVCNRIGNVRSSVYARRTKIEVFNHYGGCSCSCAGCSVTEIEFLTLDHVNGKGNVHRRKIHSKGGFSMYLWLKRNKFPKGFRVLCMNCNLSLGNYGYCPHEKE